MPNEVYLQSLFKSRGLLHFLLLKVWFGVIVFAELNNIAVSF